MANDAPKFVAPDGVYRDMYVFTTDKISRFFTGSMSSDTVDMQVSIRGQPLTSNPDLIHFEGSSFTIPNPSAYPQGLRLLSGQNRIEVKSILTSGASTSTGVVIAVLSADRDVRSAVLAPSGIYVERFDQHVEVTVDGIGDDTVVGYNFYASVSPGGGSTGYTQINLSMVTSGDQTSVYSLVGDLTVDATTASNPDGTHKADPQYLRVVGTQIDRLGNVLQTDFDQLLAIPETTSQMRTTMAVQNTRNTTRYSFVHDRRSTESSSNYPCIPNSDFNSIPDSDPLYYVVTAVYLIDNNEYESSLSPEVAAAPLTITPAIAVLPSVSRQQIVRDTSLSIFRSHPEIDIKPGSVIRDTVIDPFSTEAERLRFIVGFIQSAQSFATLLAVDDPGNTGTSIPVSQSEYKIALKQAFFLKDNVSVQNMIDNMFDSLAARYGTVRETGNRSQGEVTVFVTSRPNVDISIPIGTTVSGGGGISYTTTSLAVISTTGGLSFYNPTTGRYYTRAFIQASDTGSPGNVSAGQIRVINNTANNVQVINESATFGGSDIESNANLAARASGLLSSVDSGTYRGYSRTANGVPGVRQVNVVDAGHGLMMRDYDPVLAKHTGGKVDVWVRGDNFATVSDSFAFAFETISTDPYNHFEPVGEVSNLRFRAVNPNLTADNPIIEMISYPAYEFVFKNATTGQVFDLTGCVVVQPDQIQLSLAYNDPANLHYTDVYTGAYRYRVGSAYTFTRQPVSSISSLVGEVSGAIPYTDYLLFSGSDPLDLGRSSESGDYMRVMQLPGVEALTSIPSGKPISVVDEYHVFLGNTEYLNSLGVKPVTIHVWDITKTIEYNGPYSPNPDFTLINESGETPMGFRATSTARFKDGDELLVSYDHDEVFTISYVTNSIIGITQQAIDNDRHSTADVIVKDAIAVGVNIKATIVMLEKAIVTNVDGAVRTNLARLFGAFSLGQPVRQSDIIGVIEYTEGVAYVVAPLTTLCKSNGSQVVREFLLTEISGTDFTPITAWSSDTVKVYLINQMLTSSTIDGGGGINDPRAVFEGPNKMVLHSSTPDVNGMPIKSVVNSASIIGSGGIAIPGVAMEDTKRRLLIAIGPDSSPSDHEYYVSYVVYNDSGVQNITPSPVEYLELGELEFAYDGDTNFEALVRGRRAR